MYERVKSIEQTGNVLAVTLCMGPRVRKTQPAVPNYQADVLRGSHTSCFTVEEANGTVLAGRLNTNDKQTEAFLKKIGHRRPDIGPRAARYPGDARGPAGLQKSGNGHST